MTSPSGTWVVEWTYSPSDYFEELLEVSPKDYDLIIKDGKARATMNYDPRPQLCDRLTRELESVCQGIQLVSHQVYRLSAPAVCCYHANGKRTFFDTGSSEIVFSTGGDARMIDKDGNVLFDTHAERVQRKQSLSALAAKYGSLDPVAGELLLHHSKAVNDRDHFLVHLYDIIEALKRHFNREQSARTALQMTKAQWSELRMLANYTPLREGRHRARVDPSELRNATKHEWDAAMRIAAEMVERYLKYLDNRRA